MQNNPDMDWDSHLELLKSQSILRVMSSVQLANKVCSSDVFIKCSEIKKLLNKLGYNFGLTSILNSEIRVMKYLNYKLSLQTPYSFMEILLEISSKNLPQIETKILKLIGTKILECFYCQRENIYDRLYESMTGRSRDMNEREEFSVIESNYLYLAAAVIVAASYVYDHSKNNTYKLVLDSIAVMTKMDRNDLDDFSVILCHFSLEECHHEDI